MIADRSGPETGPAGGPARHLPVLLREVVSSLKPKDGGKYIDATFGAGGHSRAILEAANCTLLGFDRDPRTVAQSSLMISEYRGRLTVVGANFSELVEIAPRHGFDKVDGILFDFGVSSMQLDEAGRGFSFRQDGPLDMRMSARGLSALEVVNRYPEKDLARIISVLGEEKKAKFVARAIVDARKENEITRTGALAEIVRRAIHSKPGDIDPATRTFQALRIFVNDELREIEAGLLDSEKLLNDGGVLSAISFHSLEDRLVKTFITSRSQAPARSRHAPEVKVAAPSFTTKVRKPVIASEEEVKLNPRARSAKLRVAERTAAPAHKNNPLDVLLAKSPTPSDEGVR